MLSLFLFVFEKVDLMVDPSSGGGQRGRLGDRDTSSSLTFGLALTVMDMHSNDSTDSYPPPSLDDMSHVNYPKEIVIKPLWEIVLKTLFYIPVITLAILGNILVIIVVARNKRMRTTTNYYIVNLAVADCLVALTCSWVHLLDDLMPGWVLGAFFCKFNTFSQGGCGWMRKHVCTCVYIYKLNF